LGASLMRRAWEAVLVEQAGGKAVDG